MMSRKVYNPAKVSSPTTSDGSNSSADNNSNNNNSGSPGRGAGRAGGMYSLAEYHQDYQQKMSPPPPQMQDSSLSRSTGHSMPISAMGSPAYFASAEGSSLPTGSVARQRDTPEQVTSMVRMVWLGWSTQLIGMVEIAN